MQDFIKMTAKELFESLGYEQKLYDADIQYVKTDDPSEMQRIGMVKTKFIEFYMKHKEICVYSTFTHRDGSVSRSDCGILSFEEFKTTQKQVDELGW